MQTHTHTQTHKENLKIYETASSDLNHVQTHKKNLKMHAISKTVENGLFKFPIRKSVP